jgi:PIN domain nuclease of toxin-antitoxin system
MTQRLLLDTHALLWWLGGVEVDAGAASAIRDPASSVAVSAASVWEICIKRQIGRLRFDGSPTEEVTVAGFEILPITASHAERAGALPRHHRDPFDRMLVAQALLEDMTLVSRDPAFHPYEVRLLTC